MNQDDKIKFGKSVDNANHSQLSKSQHDKIILRLMEKYNISSQDAEKILIQIEQKNNQKVSSKEVPNNVYPKSKENGFESQDSGELSKDAQNADLKYNVKENESSYNKIIKSESKIDNIAKNDSKNEKHSMDSLNQNNGEEVVRHKPKKKPEQQNVDYIMSDIIPDYNKQISVELEHADLTFEVEAEITDTIKEKFINSVKRKKTEKFVIHAINDVSFKIFKGEKVGIIGYNGAGKSTLLKIITGVYLPDSGVVNVYGRVSPLLALGAGFDPNYSGRNNIMLNGAVLGYDKDFLKGKMDEIIEFSELGKYIDIPIKNYSSGMLAKLGFSIATIVEPDILIIDEILGVGDVNFRKKSADKIRSLMDSGTTVILVSHSIPQIREICDKAIWIDNGKIREIGEVNKVCENYLKDAEKASKEQLANIKFR